MSHSLEHLRALEGRNNSIILRNKRKCPANKPFISNDMSIGLSVGAYVLIGGEVSVSFDLAAWGNELISIFNDGLIYK